MEGLLEQFKDTTFNGGNWNENSSGKDWDMF